MNKSFAVIASRDQLLRKNHSIGRLRLGQAYYEHEVFAVLLLDAQHGLIDFIEMFHGMISSTAVYPRDVAKLALKHNAAAMILCHNHPSGCVEPSRADELLTQTLKSLLSLVDVRVLDHIVVAGGRAVSLVKRGLL